MTAPRRAIVTPNASADTARNRPQGLPRRQRVAAAIAGGVVSCVLLGGVLAAMTGPIDAPAVIAGQAAASGRA